MLIRKKENNGKNRTIKSGKWKKISSTWEYCKLTQHQTNSDQREDKIGGPQKNKKTSSKRILQQKFHQKNKYLDSLPYKIPRTIPSKERLIIVACHIYININNVRTNKKRKESENIKKERKTSEKAENSTEKPNFLIKARSLIRINYIKAKID